MALTVILNGPSGNVGIVCAVGAPHRGRLPGHLGNLPRRPIWRSMGNLAAYGKRWGFRVFWGCEGARCAIDRQDRQPPGKGGAEVARIGENAPTATRPHSRAARQCSAAPTHLENSAR